MAAARQGEIKILTGTEADDLAPVGGARVPVQQFGRADGTDTDIVVIEEPLEIRLVWPGAVNADPEQHSLAVTMRTPGDDFNLAAGFLFTEGVIQTEDQIQAIERSGHEDGQEDLANVVVVTLGHAPSGDLKKLDRNFFINSSCGVCGKTSIDAIKSKTSYPVSVHEWSIPADTIASLPEQLSVRQKIFAGTGGIHAAGLFNASGLCDLVCEDIGRHNAVDKLIGAEFLAGNMPLSELGLLVSGRASFELVQKARMAGCAMLAAVGAPSSLAIELAWESGMTLIGFLRDNRFNVYAGPNRIGEPKKRRPS